MLFTMRRKKVFFGLLSMVLIIQPSFSDVPESVTIEESLAAGLKVQILSLHPNKPLLLLDRQLLRRRQLMN